MSARGSRRIVVTACFMAGLAAYTQGLFYSAATLARVDSPHALLNDASRPDHPKAFFRDAIENSLRSHGLDERARNRPRLLPILSSDATDHFGRVLHGQPDELVGFEQSLIPIEDPRFVATSGKAHYSIVKFTGLIDRTVSGTLLELPDSELAKADQFEPAGYKRISAMLASGKAAWRNPR